MTAAITMSIAFHTMSASGEQGPPLGVSQGLGGVNSREAGFLLGRIHGEAHWSFMEGQAAT
ncbi:hypothetical protein [Streptomyces griseosporeus]|uniref:hypothetical protein n=1 Tax=Streptomyces griseosporeus TaxID=1910 RepID=UPI0036F677AE